jgi:hypothetical protein
MSRSGTREEKKGALSAVQLSILGHVDAVSQEDMPEMKPIKKLNTRVWPLPSLDVAKANTDPRLANDLHIQGVCKQFMATVLDMHQSKGGPRYIVVPRAFCDIYWFMYMFDILPNNELLCASSKPVLTTQPEGRQSTVIYKAWLYNVVRVKYALTQTQDGKDVTNDYVVYAVPHTSKEMELTYKWYVRLLYRFANVIAELNKADMAEPRFHMKTQVPLLEPSEPESIKPPQKMRAVAWTDSGKDGFFPDEDVYAHVPRLLTETSTDADNDMLTIETGGYGDCLYYSVSFLFARAGLYRANEISETVMKHMRHDTLALASPRLTNAYLQLANSYEGLDGTKRPFHHFADINTLHLLARHPLALKYSIGFHGVTQPGVYGGALPTFPSPRPTTKWWFIIANNSVHYRPIARRLPSRSLEYAFSTKRMERVFPPQEWKRSFGDKSSYEFERPSRQKKLIAEFEAERESQVQEKQDKQKREQAQEEQKKQKQEQARQKQARQKQLERKKEQDTRAAGRKKEQQITFKAKVKKVHQKQQRTNASVNWKTGSSVIEIVSDDDVEIVSANDGDDGR